MARLSRSERSTLWRIGLVVFVVVVLYTVSHHREVGRAKYSRAKTEIAYLQIVLEHYRDDYGHYPTTDDGLGELLNDDIDPAFVRGMAALAPRVPRDPWGREYFYQSDGSSYVLGSFGPDGNAEHPDPDLPLRRK